MERPALQRIEAGGVAYWTDGALLQSKGVLVAFSERSGGVSDAPFSALNLAAHVGDDPVCVDANRQHFLDAVGVGRLTDRLTTCEQVHGTQLRVVTADDIGRGARAVSGPAPVGSTDALVTALADVPMLLLFADCVPVVLVAPGPVVAVVHAGWRGALAGIAATSASRLAVHAGCETSAIVAYIGPHIGPCHYKVSDDVLSLFQSAFGNLARAESGGLDLGAVVVESLTRSGVDKCSITALGTCTAESTECFFSYRAEGGLTGRHGALACILSSS